VSGSGLAAEGEVTSGVWAGVGVLAGANGPAKSIG